MQGTKNIAWRKSSRCGSNACVEVAKVEDTMLLRDSKNPATPPMSLDLGQWAGFVADVANGAFNDLPNQMFE